MTRWNGYQIEMRRWFHQHPEESTKEVKTAERIRAELDRAGIEWRPCGLGTGTLARIVGAQPAARSSFAATSTRFPSTRKRSFPLRAKSPGVMHACGHDCHISMLLTAAMMINEIKDQLKGTIVFAFQPAEELGVGARAMIEEGALEGVDACFGHARLVRLSGGHRRAAQGPDDGLGRLLQDSRQGQVHPRRPAAARRRRAPHGRRHRAEPAVHRLARNLSGRHGRRHGRQVPFGHALQRCGRHRRARRHHPHLQPRRARPV